MRCLEPHIRWRPALLALVLGLAALLRALPGTSPSTAAADPLLAGAHVLCLGADGGQGEAPSAPPHEGCDLCCLPGGRLVVALPSLSGPVQPPVAWHLDDERPLSPDARAPPYEAWAIERAQRGPPRA